MAYDEQTRESVRKYMLETYRGLDEAPTRWRRNPDDEARWVQAEIDDAIGRLKSAYNLLDR